MTIINTANIFRLMQFGHKINHIVLAKFAFFVCSICCLFFSKIDILVTKKMCIM